MTLYRVALRWWGRVETVRHYSAPTPEQAKQFAIEDGHVVIGVTPAKTGSK